MTSSTMMTGADSLTTMTHSAELRPVTPNMAAAPVYKMPKWRAMDVAIAPTSHLLSQGGICAHMHARTCECVCL